MRVQISAQLFMSDYISFLSVAALMELSPQLDSHIVHDLQMNFRLRRVLLLIKPFSSSVLMNFCSTESELGVVEKRKRYQRQIIVYRIIKIHDVQNTVSTAAVKSKKSFCDLSLKHVLRQIQSLVAQETPQQYSIVTSSSQCSDVRTCPHTRAICNSVTVMKRRRFMTVCLFRELSMFEVVIIIRILSSIECRLIPRSAIASTKSWEHFTFKEKNILQEKDLRPQNFHTFFYIDHHVLCGGF